MKLSTFSFDHSNGWSVKTFPALDSEQTLIFVFGAPEFIDDPDPISELVDAYPRSKIIGCSSAGEIAGPFVNDASISVAVLQFERSRIAVSSTKLAGSTSSFAAGEMLARQLFQDDLCSLFVLSDGLRINGAELARGIGSVLPPDIIITGGLAADGNHFKRTWVLSDGKLQEDIVVAAAFYGGNLQITYGCRSGWESFGPERRITRSSGNILFELDGRSVLSLYKEYLGDLADRLPATALLLPLGIRQDTVDSRETVRALVGINESDQSITFAGNMPKGYLAQLMRTGPDRLLDSASMAAEQARDNMAIAGPMLTVAISGAGRRLLLGERVEEETELTLQHLPRGTHQIGFYSYGELSLGASGICELQNQTMTLTTFSEA